MLQSATTSATPMPASIHHRRSSCRVCGHPHPEPFLDLGRSPLANSFLASADEFQGEASFPLEVFFCPSCSLVQLLDVIHPEVLFRHYLYVSGTSETMRAHHQQYAETVIAHLNLGPADLVTEVASNDGTLLSQFRDRGTRILGIEPASNIARMARASGIDTIDRFFNMSLAREVRQERGPSRAVIGNNVLAHVDDPCDFLAGATHLLGPGGLVIFEVPYLGWFLDRLEYDTIYHEHLCYFSVQALARLTESVGLRITRIDKVSVHGGSLRVYAGNVADYPSHSATALEMIAAERRAGLHQLPAYLAFADAVAANRRALRSLLESLRAEGKTVAAYGAPAKGNTLLNYCGIGTDLVSFTVDRNPLKVGLFTPGMHLPVLPVSVLLEKEPDYLLILAWNFAPEIIEQQQEYQRRGGHFILPVPEPRIV